MALSGHNICTTGDSLMNLTCSVLYRSDLILSLYTHVYTLSLHLTDLVSFLFVMITCDPLRIIINYPVHMCKDNWLLSLSLLSTVNTKIIKSHVLGICACCKHNQSVDISRSTLPGVCNAHNIANSSTNIAFQM